MPYPGTHKGHDYREILVIDDNPQNRKLVRLSLECTDNLKVLEASNAAECMEIIKTHKPKLFLIDIMLPDCHGQQLLFSLRKLPQFIDVPMVAFTAYLSENDMKKGSLSGFNGYITKPIQPAQLLETVLDFIIPVPDNERSYFGKKILLVDDDPIQLKLMRIFFGTYGFTIQCANNGKEALEIFQKEPFDIIISDVFMPEVDGFKLCSKIRNGRTNPKIPIVLTTNHSVNEKDLTLAKKVGADDYIIRASNLLVLSKSVISLVCPKQTNADRKNTA